MARPRKPTALKVAHGDRKDRINGDEPASPPGLGAAPEWFDDLARSAWSRLSAILDEMKLSARADSEAAMLYCVAYSTWRKALVIVAKEGFSVETDSTTKAHPLFPVIAESARQMHRVLSQFGMTPSARAGLHVESKAEGDELLAYFSGKADGKTTKARKA